MLRVSSQPQRLSRPMLQKLSRSVTVHSAHVCTRTQSNSLLLTSTHSTMQHIDRANITPIAIALNASKHAFRSIHSQPSSTAQGQALPTSRPVNSTVKVVQPRAPSRPSTLAAFTSPILVSPWLPTSFSSRHMSSQAFQPRDRIKVKEAEIVQKSSTSTEVTADQNTSSIASPAATSATTSATSTTGNADSVSTVTAGEEVLANPGLSRFMGRVYRTTGLSMAASLGLSLVFSSAAAATIGVGAGSAVLTTMAVGGAVSSIVSGLLLFFSKRPPTVKNSENHLITYNPTWRKGLFGTFVVSNAVSISPLVLIANAISPLIVPAAAGAAALVMGGASWYAYQKPNSSLLSLGAPLAGALVGMVGMQIAAAATFFMIGPNVFSASMFTVQPYFGIVLFSFFTAFDTHNAIAEYKKGDADHLVHAVAFYLNFINLLIDFMRAILDAVKAAAE